MPKAEGLTVVTRTEFDPKTEDFTPIIREVEKQNPEVMMVYTARMNKGAQIMEAHKRIQSKMLLVANSTSQNRIALKMAKENADGLYSVVEVVSALNEFTKKFEMDYKAAYSDEVELLYAWSYDAVRAIAKASEKGSDPKTELLAIGGMPALAGKLSFQGSGEGIKTQHTSRSRTKGLRWSNLARIA